MGGCCCGFGWGFNWILPWWRVRWRPAGGCSCRSLHTASPSPPHPPSESPLIHHTGCSGPCPRSPWRHQERRNILKDAYRLLKINQYLSLGSRSSSCSPETKKQQKTDSDFLFKFNLSPQQQNQNMFSHYHKDGTSFGNLENTATMCPNYKS